MVKDLSIKFADLTDDEKIQVFHKIEHLVKNELASENQDNDFHAGSYDAYLNINQIIEYHK